MSDLKQIERTHKALANRRRLAILRHLQKEKEESVGRIARHLNLSFKATSRHLSILFSADLLDKNQRSTEIFYSIAKRIHRIVLETLNHL